MPHANPSDDDLRRILTDARTIAMVGASSNPERESHHIFGRLKLVGYHLIPVNPNETVVFGEKAYPTLEAIPEKVDIVDVFRRAEDTPAIADSAVKIGAKVLWLQRGITNEEAATRAEAGGLTVVMDECLATKHALLGVAKK